MKRQQAHSWRKRPVFFQEASPGISRSAKSIALELARRTASRFRILEHRCFRLSCGERDEKSGAAQEFTAGGRGGREARLPMLKVTGACRAAGAASGFGPPR